MNNAARHSDARRIAVSVAERFGVIGLTVRDDGRGGAGFAGGTGLAGLAERLRAFDGRLRIA